jgi:diguanylate cyclase (GGDEF)-like protein
MSLIRQVWLLLLGTLVLAFAGSVGVSLVSSRDALQTQLRLKNSDNAASLALALSQQKGEREPMGLLLAAQFDTGSYRSIRLVGADEAPIFAREANLAPAHAPWWFAALLPIESVPGVAQVSDGSRALGAVQVVSHTAFAHDELWQGGLRSALALGVIGLVAAALASWAVSHIRKPLDDTVQQARSLVDGQFVVMPEPSAPELRRLTQAMNTMVSRLKHTFEAQAMQLEALRQQAHSDPLTGLSNRKHFMGQLVAMLQRDDGAADAGLVLLRVLNLADVNRNIGHAAADRMIAAVAQAMQAYTQRVTGCHAGRLNGSDFALALPVGGVALETARAVVEALRVALPAFGHGIGIAVGAVEVHAERELAALLGSADAALARAESQGTFAIEHVGPSDARRTGVALQGETAWRHGIGESLSAGRARLVAFPLLNARGDLIHLECPLRLQLDPAGGFEAAARWMPLALRSQLHGDVDERAVALALEAIANDKRPRCVNLAPASLTTSTFIARLRTLLFKHRDAARLLWLDVPEVAATERFAALQELTRQLRPTGVRIGLEHAGERLGRIKRLLDVGLDYVKLDASAVHGAAGDEARQGFLRSAITMLHGLSMQVFAEGVTGTDDAQCLWQLGVDGITGPWASAQRRDLVGD